MISVKMQLMHLGYSVPPREHLLLYWNRVHLKEVISVVNSSFLMVIKIIDGFKNAYVNFATIYTEQVAFWAEP